VNIEESFASHPHDIMVFLFNPSSLPARRKMIKSSFYGEIEVKWDKVRAVVTRGCLYDLEDF